MEKVWLLVSDVDGTMLGDDEALARLAQWYEGHREVLRLAYASGRFFNSVVESIETTSLPEPDAIIGGVGTDINIYPSGGMIEEWHKKIGRNWDARRLRELLSGRAGLERQPEEFQSPFKVSYYLTDASPDDLLALKNEVRETSIEAHVVYSSGRDLDFLPAGANKGTAAAFLSSIWNIPADDVIASGDSGNDRALFEQGFLGIVVGNAHEELKRLCSSRVYHARHPFAAGVLEGLRYWMERY